MPFLYRYKIPIYFMITKNLIALATGLTMLMTLGVMALASDVTVSGDVSAYIEVTANYSAVTFASLTSPSSNNAGVDQLTGLYNFTVDTNKDYTVSANGTDFAGTPSGTIAIANLKFEQLNVAGNLAVGDATALSVSSTQMGSDVAFADAVNYHGYWLTVPSSRPAGTYTATITILIANV